MMDVDVEPVRQISGASKSSHKSSMDGEEQKISLKRRQTIMLVKDFVKAEEEKERKEEQATLRKSRSTV